MTQKELFIQGAGIREMKLARVPDDATVQDLANAAAEHGLGPDAAAHPLVFVEGGTEPLPLHLSIEAAGIGEHAHVHVHSCERIHVTVNFGKESKQHPFSPATTIEVIRSWALDVFEIGGEDAVDHVLQRCNSQDRPDEEVHVGALTDGDTCAVCFDLVPARRIEG